MIRSADLSGLDEFMTPVQFYARPLALLTESGLSKAEKIEMLQQAVEFVHEEAAVKAIWGEPKPPKKPRGKKTA